jgi:alpha-1,2-mannosyltransferase
VVSVTAFVASGIRIATIGQGHVFPRAQFDAAAPAGCVRADDPGALIEMNRLSRDLRARCRVAIDVTGITYDSLERVGPGGRTLDRSHNLAFQRYLYNYLVSGRSFVVARGRDDGIPPGFERALDRRPLITRADGLELRQGTAVS